jgi:hypothetical protein
MVGGYRYVSIRASECEGTQEGRMGIADFSVWQLPMSMANVSTENQYSKTEVVVCQHGEQDGPSDAVAHATSVRTTGMLTAEVMPSSHPTLMNMFIYIIHSSDEIRLVS